ncbi:MAG: hypothetical protein J6B91_05430 [Prevotella sp.]|nr:hypothetical protein [Prevotella sp.]
MKNFKILVACEESGRVTEAFRNKGFQAFSCDLIPTSGNMPAYHIIGNALEVMQREKWDCVIAFPPCTYLTNASARRMRVNGSIVRDRYNQMLRARDFFLAFYYANVPHIAIENPVPMKICNLPRYTQIIEPYFFGDPYKKRTCLWLNGLPELTRTCYDSQTIQLWVDGGSKKKDGTSRNNRGQGFRDPKQRSKTFPGVAWAMAEQWGEYFKERYS